MRYILKAQQEIFQKKGVSRQLLSAMIEEHIAY